MFNAFIGVTDKSWFNTLRSQPGIDEANFWLPSDRGFKALKPNELFLFKLHYPENAIVGGGLFAHFTILPVSLAWEAFEVKNGAHSLADLRRKIGQYRKASADPWEDFKIGCILLEQPFFLPEEKWIPAPSDWSPNIVSGRTYDLTREPGATILRQLQHVRGDIAVAQTARVVREAPVHYGDPVIVIPRLGQGSFRVLVTDAYERKCAISNERTLPVLDAAHIKPFSASGASSVSNGILLRKDLHTLFDKGYLTITPELRVEVSRRIREEFENGRDYYKYQGQPMRPPRDLWEQPAEEYLVWHNENVFRG